MSDAGGELTTGWEADVPVEDSLVRRFLFGEVDRMRLVAASLGGRYERSDELVLADPGTGFSFDTAAVLLQPARGAQEAAAVEAATAFFPAERTWSLYSMWPTADLRPLGLELVGHPPMMFRPAGGPGEAAARPLPEGFRVAEVTSPEELDAYSRVVVEGYPMADGGSIGGPGLLGSDYRFWVGWEGERAVSGAAAHVAHGLTEVTWVATLPDARGRGYGRAVTWAAICAEPALPAVLIASDHGRPVYERLGFLSVMRMTLWWRPGAQRRST
ncbi:MAG: GNAT family N-acetyltransferase [Acidimicrobiia bacterium]